MLLDETVSATDEVIWKKKTKKMEKSIWSLDKCKNALKNIRKIRPLGVNLV